MTEIDPVLEKYKGIAEASIAALREGRVSPFKGFIDLENRFNVSVKFLANTEYDIKGRVIRRLQDLPAELGVLYFIAGGEPKANFPLHSTILEGVYESRSGFTRSRVFADLKQDPRVKEVKEELLRIDNVGLFGPDYYFDDLLIANETILVAATKIPTSIIKAREVLSEIYIENGLKPLPMDNILHTSIARMIQLPGLSQTANYIERLNGIKKEVQVNPIGVRIADIFIGTAHQLLGQY